MATYHHARKPSVPWHEQRWFMTLVVLGWVIGIVVAVLLAVAPDVVWGLLFNV